MTIQVHHILYFIYYHLQQHPPIPFSRKFHAAKQKVKGIWVDSLMKTQHVASLSPP